MHDSSLGRTRSQLLSGDAKKNKKSTSNLHPLGAFLKEWMYLEKSQFQYGFKITISALVKDNFISNMKVKTIRQVRNIKRVSHKERAPQIYLICAIDTASSGPSTSVSSWETKTFQPVTDWNRAPREAMTWDTTSVYKASFENHIRWNMNKMLSQIKDGDSDLGSNSLLLGFSYYTNMFFTG